MATELMQFYFWKTDIQIINDREEKKHQIVSLFNKKKIRILTSTLHRSKFDVGLLLNATSFRIYSSKTYTYISQINYLKSPTETYFI